MPSVLTGFLRRHATMIPSATSRHGGSFSHRFKKLEKCDRRGDFLLLQRERETLYGMEKLLTAKAIG